MSNLFDYLTWRGDLTLAQAPFNDIDALILSRLSYVPFDGLVPDSFMKSVTVEATAKAFAATPELWELLIMKADGDLLAALGASPRFQGMRLSGYVHQRDEAQEKQFAAITIGTGDDSHFISYRGTDATLLGWKESVNMSFMPRIPGQEAAVNYLERAARALNGPLRVGGHSKGGNLAVYAAAFCDTTAQARVTRVYSHDGPGLHPEMLQKEGYHAILERIRAIVPQTSIVGMLLGSGGPHIVIQSGGTGPWQHDLYQWEVCGDSFVELPDVSTSSKFIDHTITDWLEALAPEQRENFVEALFSVLDATGVTSILELASVRPANAARILKAFGVMDASMRESVTHALWHLLRAAMGNGGMLKPSFLDKLPWK